MKRTAPFLLLAAASLALAACNEPSEPLSQAPGSPPASPRVTGAPGSDAAVPAPQSPVAKSSPQQRLEADMELSSKVKDVLQTSGSSRIEVAANDGVVTLYGTVDTPADKDRIAVAALEVDGVRSVVNNLVVMRTS
jgi:osmotically-inducible protein OsmY